MNSSEVQRLFSFMPSELPALDSKEPVKYETRSAKYYSHLARLACQELTSNVESGKPLKRTMLMVAPFSAIIMHAKSLGDYDIVDKLDQSRFVREIVLDTFGSQQEFAGPEYINGLQVLVESFFDAASLKKSAKLKLAKLAEIFARKIEEVENYSTLPFIGFSGNREYHEKRSEEPKPYARPKDEEVLVPRDPGVLKEERTGSKPRLVNGHSDGGSSMSRLDMIRAAAQKWHA